MLMLFQGIRLIKLIYFRLRSNETMSLYLSQDDEMKKELRDIFESERHKLEQNQVFPSWIINILQVARELVYTKYSPIFMSAIFIYVIFALVWIFYNVVSYKRCV